MGVLVIQLKEGRNLEPKDSSGTSDPFIKFKVVSSADPTIESKSVKSRTIKRSLNPQWNEILEIPINESTTKGYALCLWVQDWNKIKKAQSMGEAIVPLDGLEAGVPRQFHIDLTNTSTAGVISMVLTHKIQEYHRIYIQYNNEPLFQFDLLRRVKLSTQLDFLCQMVKAGNPDDFSLQLENESIITQENLLDPNFTIPENSIVKLVLRPNVAVQTVLDNLRSNEREKQKAATFQLKEKLKQDSNFTQAFIAADGHVVLQDVILNSQKNTLAYALNALDYSMSYGYGWDTKTAVVEKLIQLIKEDSPNFNVLGGSLRILVHLAGSRLHGYPAIISAIEKTHIEFDAFLGRIQNLLSCDDMNIQLSALDFINSMVASAPDSQTQDLINLLETRNLTKVLKSRFQTSSPEYRAQVLRYLGLKYDLDHAPTTYNKDNPDHEKMLLELWATVFPDSPLESRVSEQWKNMGFQGTDPATDFRGMGIVSLQNLLYFAKNYTEIFRKMLYEQSTNSADMCYYPVAVAGINLCKLLFDMFSDLKSKNLKQIDILLDHPRAFQEIFCICLRFFDQVWEDMEASYFDFNSVITEVESDLTKSLMECSTVEQLQNRCLQQDKKKRKERKKKKAGQPVAVMKQPTSPPPMRGAQSLHDAVRSGNTVKVSQLIKDGVDVNKLDSSGTSPLHVAVTEGNIDLVRLLLWKDADVSLKKPDGWTPLHEAAKNASLEVCDILLHRGADPNAETNDGVIPLHYLARRKLEGVSRELFIDVLNGMLERGANINHHKNSNQETPLHYAVTSGLVENAALLIQHGADLNHKNKRGYTPLHIAILTESPELVGLLVSAGADINIKCKEGSANELAKKVRGMEEILKSAKVSTQNQPETKIFPQQNPYLGQVHKRQSSSIAVERANQQASKVKGYHGRIGKETAFSLCKKLGNDCYLLRMSNVHASFNLTVCRSGQIQDLLVYPRTNGGYSIQVDSNQTITDTKTYPSLLDLVVQSPVLAGCVPVVVTDVKQRLEELNLMIQDVLATQQQQDLEKKKHKLKRAMADVVAILQEK